MQLPDSVQNILAYGQGYNDGMKDGNICGFHDALVCAVNDLTELLKKYHDMEKEYAGLQAKAYRERMENKPQLESATENHARWIPNGRDSSYNSFILCSHCNHEVVMYADSEKSEPKYCEECGYRMDATDTNYGSKGGNDK